MKTNYSVVPKMLFNTPSLGFNVLRALLAPLRIKLFDYNFGNGEAKGLSLVTFRITPLCNLKCIMCGQRGETGVLKGKYAVEESKKLVPIERYKKIIDEISVKNPVLYVWGGEPFMYPDFMELASYMSKKCPTFTVNTNGTYLADNAERIVRDQWTAVYVSLDGFQDINDAIRGKGSYERVMRGFEAINREKKKQKSVRPYLGVVTTVSDMNYLYLDKLVEVLPQYNLTWHMINLGTYTDQSIIDKQKVFMKDNFDIEINCLQGFANGHNKGIDGVEFNKILEKVHKIKTGYPVITVPAINPDKIGEYYLEFDKLVRDKCVSPWMCANIDYNGDVHFCADYPDYVVGNIKEMGFFDAYNGEKAHKFRQKLKESPNGIFPGCNRCYQLMLLGRKKQGY